jgi:hypothetical protein
MQAADRAILARRTAVLAWGVAALFALLAAVLTVLYFRGAFDSAAPPAPVRFTGGGASHRPLDQLEIHT